MTATTPTALRNRALDNLATDIVGDATVATPTPMSRADIETYFRLHYSRLVRAARRYSRTWEDAEDAVGELFLRLCEGCAYSGHSAPFTYLFSATVRRALSIRRRESLRAHDSLPAHDSHPASAEPLSEAEQREAVQSVHVALASLPDNQRTALTLFAAGLTIEDIADDMCIPLTSVKNHLHRGRDRLRATIARLAN